MPRSRPEDIIHLGGDCKRVYSLLVPEWVRYMEYLRAHYPYLFSLAMRKNPFDTSASVVIGTAKQCLNLAPGSPLFPRP